MVRKKVLVVGPSPHRSKGGMATVIDEIRTDKELGKEFDIDIYDSYIDSNKIGVLIYSILAFVKFYFTKRNYDIYHIHAASRGSTFRKGYYVRCAKRWGKKVILHIHGASYMVFYNEVNEEKKTKIKNILKCSDMVIALSDEWKKRFDETFGLNNCMVLENGIDTEKLKKAITEPNIYQKSFVSLGRLGKRKGTYDLVDAIEIAKNEIPDIKCYLAGDGEIEKVTNIVNKRGLEKNIEIIGWADFKKKIELLSKVSTVILPSYNEGLPMAILEGMACGKAIISSKVGAIPEVVSNNNGILINAGDVKELSKAIIRCASDLEYIKSASHENIDKINNNFSMRYMHNKLTKYYYEV